MSVPRRDRSLWLLVVLSLLGFALRLALLDAQPIWWDEAISIHLATSSVWELLANRAAHVHPPLYFLLLKGWVALVGSAAFSVRFLSAAWNVPLIPAVYAFARRWVGRRTGSIAATLVAVSPLYVIYSQEARVYALLPLVYVALLALLERLTREATLRWRDWFLLAVVEAAGLLLHYVFIFPVAYVNLVILLRLRSDRLALARWLTSTGAVVALCLPWVVAVLLNWQAVIADVGADMPFVEPVPLDHFARLLWSFQWNGLTRALVYPPLWITALVLAGLVALAVGWLLWDEETRRPLIRLLAHWLVPLSGALLMWQAKPLSHPRYVALFAVALLLVCAYALARLIERRGGTILAALLGLAILSNSLISLRAYYVDPDFAKDDARGVAAAIAARSEAGDLVIVPPEDWSVPYYYDGPALVDMSWAGDSAADWERLADLTRDAEHVFLVDYHRATRDPRGIYPFALESAGTLARRQTFKGLFLRDYRLDHSVGPPQLGPADALFGPLRLTGAWVEQDAPADTAVAVALRWRLEAPVDTPLRGGLHLRGAGGWQWATVDNWLLDHGGYPTDEWPVGHEVTTYHVVPLPTGTPPLTFDLSLGVYQVDEADSVRPLDLVDAAGNPQGQSVELGEVDLAQPLGLTSDPYRVADAVPAWDQPIDLGDGLALAGASLDRESAAPGQPLFVTLAWRADVPIDGPLTATLILEQGGGVLATVGQTVGGEYPVDRWAAGQMVVEHRRLIIPPGATDGPATVRLDVGEVEIPVGEVAVAAGEHVFDAPPIAYPFRVRFGDVAELLGYDLDMSTVISGEPVPITLYWRALEGVNAANYTIFTHILADDGRLVGQHDGLPAGGGRPTPGWVAGEIVVDRHEMMFREPYTGPAQIELGLYDAATVDRVPTEDGALYVILPVTLDVIQP